MLKEEMLNVAAQAVEMAKKSGAQDASVNFVRSRNVAFEVRNGTVEKTEDSTSRRLSVHLYADGRYSNHQTSDLRSDSLKKFIEEAVYLTRAVEQDPFRRILPAHFFGAIPRIELGLADPAIKTRNREQQLTTCQAMNDEMAGKPLVISASSSCEENQITSMMVGSNGFQGFMEKTINGLYAEVTIEGMNGKKPNSGFGMVATHLSELRAPQEIAREALRRTLAIRQIKRVQP